MAQGSGLQPTFKLGLAMQGEGFASHCWPKDSEGWAQKYGKGHEVRIS